MENILHRLDASGVELPLKFNDPFCYEPHELCRRAYSDVLSWPLMRGSDADFMREIGRGKMFGVLVVSGGEGGTGFIAAFSGQICGRFDWPGFVPPVFDYLAPDGHFKRTEREISKLNREIAAAEAGVLAPAEGDYARMERQLGHDVAEAEAAMREGKARRDRRRAQGSVGVAETEQMIRESQYMKAQVGRKKLAMKEQLKPYAERVERAKAMVEELKSCRREMSERLQMWLFDNTVLLNGHGKRLSVGQLYATSECRIAPSGTGECCAPKLLNYAFAHGLRPVAMAEYWFGESPTGEVRHHESHYPACHGKCRQVLGWMLRGLDMANPPLPPAGLTPEIVYEDDHLCVVSKPSGLLTVPGVSNRVSVLTYLRDRYGRERDVRMAHRIDEDTSGLVIATFGLDSYRRIQSLFAARQIDKTYIAVLDGDIIERGLAPEGDIVLPLMPDIDDRPRQIVCPDGKPSVSHYRVVGHGRGRTRVEFHPITGRTHQLRVHSAASAGLGCPIVGDRLYGRRAHTSQRLLLHAAAISFVSPFDGRTLSFRSEPDF